MSKSAKNSSIYINQSCGYGEGGEIKRLLDLAQTSFREDPLKSAAEWGKERIVSERHNVKNRQASQNICRGRVVRYLRIDVRYLLDRAAFARAPVLRGHDAAISALSEFLDELVLRVDDKGRVQSGEAVPLHDAVEGDGGGTKQGTSHSIIYPQRRSASGYWV
jgi:hypothetical protein